MRKLALVLFVCSLFIGKIHAQSAEAHCEHLRDKTLIFLDVKLGKHIKMQNDFFGVNDYVGPIELKYVQNMEVESNNKQLFQYKDEKKDVLLEMEVDKFERKKFQIVDFGINVSKQIKSANPKVSAYKCTLY